MSAADFEYYINSQAIALKLDKTLPLAVGLSGGADSVALLSALVAAGWKAIALHCNFHLRGEESDRDMNFCRSLAVSLGVVYFETEFDTMAEKEPGESVEMAARRLRYGWFREIMAETGAQALVTGHHRDDSVETLLMNLFRGTGVKGLSGINPRGDRRCSLMLNLSRKDILTYLNEKNLTFVTDSTNLENDYSRNRIRNVVLPVIEENFPNAVNGIARTAANLSDASRLISRAVELLAETYFIGDVLRLEEVATEEFSDTVLYYLLKPYGFDRSATDSILESRSESGKKFFSPEYMAVINRGTLELTPRGEMERQSVFGGIVTEIIPAGQLKGFDTTHHTLYLDADLLPADFRPELRAWREGDYIRPFGMKGRKKLVSDIFSDAKISVGRKARIPLLTLGSEILWVYGIRETDRYRITPDTQRVMVVRVGNEKL